jgi:hypothetical protein
MNILLPPELVSKRRSWTVVILVCVGVAVVIAGWALAVHFISTGGFTRAQDNMFGDQHLKTSVALIELHKVRYGKYPDSLSDLKFTGEWDQIALKSVAYYPNADRTAYFIEVERGWIGKPDLQMPAEFWQGTGYLATLKPSH